MIATGSLPSTRVQVLHALPGRLRLHLPAWSGRGGRELEKELRGVAAVRRVEANPVTRNVLVEFDPNAIEQRELLTVVDRAENRGNQIQHEEAPLPPVIQDQAGGRTQRVRIPMRGLDRDPELARRVVERLQQHRGVKAHANPLTGRVLVEFDESMTELRELLTEVTDMELPPLPDEAPPGHPLDPAPLVQSSLRTAGAAVGLALVAGRRLAGASGPLPGMKVAAGLSTVIAVLRGFPTFRNGMRRLLGPHTADAVFSTANAATLAYVGNPLGLAVIGLESVLLLRTVMARRAVWLRYEDRLAGKA
ncbi:MAG TPA: hypothetical protein VFA18_09060, partial [Gemmataceae bacterium]|nr:hypothetical protein [Gemmataceae bacterium]